MKCIRNSQTKVISRVNDEVAERLVREGKAAFVAKATWKQEVRDVGKK